MGKWFKKQSLARHYLPIVSIVGCELEGDGAFVILRFTNPSYLSQSQVTSEVQFTVAEGAGENINSKVRVCRGGGLIAVFLLFNVNAILRNNCDFTLFPVKRIVQVDIKHYGPYLITAVDEVEADDIDLAKHVEEIHARLGLADDADTEVVDRTYKSVCLKWPLITMGTVEETKEQKFSLMIRTEFGLKGANVEHSMRIFVTL